MRTLVQCPYCINYQSLRFSSLKLVLFRPIVYLRLASYL